jgi:phosphate-selective porin OprO/OprP
MGDVARCVIAAAILFLTARSARAQDAHPAEQPASAYDKIWKLTDWYESESNPVVQKILFTGRFQEDFAGISADQGRASEWNLRRLRLGPKITLFRHYLVHAEVDLNPQEHDPFYVRLTDAYLLWSKNPKVAIAVGKQSVPFTQEGATSSKELITIDRSNLANNIWFTQEYIPGVSASGRVSAWTYRAGIYSGGAANREFGDFSGGAFTLGVIGYDFATKLGVREAVLAGNYVYQRPDRRNTFTRRFEQIASLNFKLDDGRWALRSDLSRTTGYLGQSGILGVMAMPSFRVTPKFEVVARVTFLDSDEVNGLGVATYENRVTHGAGDRYTEGYLGVNYYFYGHRLKLQSGVERATMRDLAGDGGAYAGTSWTTGLRVGW